MNPLNAVLRDTVSGLQKLFGDRLKNIWLYGSYARGDQTDESDIDVMALVDLSAGGTGTVSAANQRFLIGFGFEIRCFAGD